MLPKNQRLSRDGFPKGRPNMRRSFSWGTISLYSGEPKVAIVVSKKTLKKAHDRNRAKRRVYASFEHHKVPCAVVVQLRSEALTASFNVIKGDIERTLQ